MPFEKGHPPYPGIEKGWFKKGQTPWSKSQKGVTLNTGRTHFRKGHIPWNKGKRCKYLENEGNPNWKGDDVGYFALHSWVARKLGKANRCEKCGVKDRKYEWASKSGEYKRDLNDWVSLCLSCHRKHDNQGFKAWKTRRKDAQENSTK